MVWCIKIIWMVLLLEMGSLKVNISAQPASLGDDKELELTCMYNVGEEGGSLQAIMWTAEQGGDIFTWKVNPGTADVIGPTPMYKDRIIWVD